MKVVIILLFSIIAIAAHGQLQTSSTKGYSQKLTKQSRYSKTDYNPILIHRPLNPQNETILLEQQKPANDFSQAKSHFKTSEEIELPLIQYGFEDAYDNNWIPNDNSMAISNDGFMVTMRNSMISFYDPSHQLIQTQTLNAFTDSLGLPQTKFDPRVMYDQNEDRFVTVMLGGYYHNTSQVVIGFSSTSNPQDEWYFYNVPGNFLNDSSWSDFPSIALSNEELFITITNFDDYLTSSYWKFTGCRIIQMNKMQGYNGDSIVDFNYHLVNPGFGVPIPSDVYYYNVIPVKSADTLIGPDMYFVSTLDCPAPDTAGQFDPNDTVFLVKFNGNQYDAGFNIESHYLQSPFNYGISGSTPQPQNQALKTNYNTVKDAIFFNNKIHFLLNSIDYSNDQAGVYHGIIEDPDGTRLLSAIMLSYDSIGIAYPAMAWAGTSVADEKFIIGFNYTSSVLYPGNACIVYDNGSYSNMKVLKEGQSVMNLTSSNAERWGDYTCMQRKHNEPEFIFYAGSFGMSNDTRTWISKITLDTAYLSINEFTDFEAKIYPVPASERVQVLFETADPQQCVFTIYSIDGALVGEVLTQRVKAGKNEISFDISTLKNRVYILVISGSKGYTFSKKFLVSH
ncbi:MAG: T9SS type A sorting domain-containing protein [Bacteroidales bacterium]|nr:T9SS type A sorting domain-containing protein [Bacteroidales bacterium]